METQHHAPGPHLYRLKAKDSRVRVEGDVFGRGRLLLGRSESCDVVINDDGVSAVHAVLEITASGARIYDMNSTNGTWYAGKKIVVQDLQPGDSFSVGGAELIFLAYTPDAELPPVLETLEPIKGEASTSNTKRPPVSPQVQADVPYVLYPLALDPKADNSEYIFEDAETLYPIFRYESAKQAVEVIILFKDRVFSVDYLPEEDGTYGLAGFKPNDQELEFPYLGKTERISFIDIRGGQASVHKIPGYEILHLSENQSKAVNQGVGLVELKAQDILRFHKGAVQIFVRQVEAPPKVAAAPLMRRDPVMRWYLMLFLVLTALFSAGIQFIHMDEEQIKEELKEKAPERMAKILYRQKLTSNTNKTIEKTENAPKRAQKAPDKPAVVKEVPKKPQPEVKKPDVADTPKQNLKPDPGKKSAQEKKVVRKGNPKDTRPPVGTAGGAKGASVAHPAKATLTANTHGPVEVYKSADFSSSVSTVLAKGGSLSGVTTRTATGSGSSSDFGVGVGSGTGNGAELKKATVSGNAGSLVGASQGAIGVSKGAEGLSSKRAIYTAGIPSETVVLGSMDPDVIRRILMDNLPKFRFCYQSELERTGSELQGLIKLNFVIGASGHVNQAGVDNATNLPSSVKRCVVDVLRGIQFPEPMGGGTVEVKQPMNFYPKRI